MLTKFYIFHIFLDVIVILMVSLAFLRIMELVVQINFQNQFLKRMDVPLIFEMLNFHHTHILIFDLDLLPIISLSNLLHLQ